MESGAGVDGAVKLYMNRNEQAFVSYFPAEAVDYDEFNGWLEYRLLPAIRTLASRTSKAITEVPITFWVGIRETARTPSGEVFVFTTPWENTKPVNEALTKAMGEIPQAKLLEGVETVPDDFFPYAQVFRNTVFRLYGDFSDEAGLQQVEIFFYSDTVELTLDSISNGLCENSEWDAEPWVRAEITSGVSNAQIREHQISSSGLFLLPDDFDEDESESLDEDESESLDEDEEHDRYLFADVIQWFAEQGWDGQAYPDDCVMTTLQPLDNGTFRVVAQVLEDRNWFICQVVAPVPTPPGRRGAVAEFLNRINHACALGSYAMDPEDGEVIFKTSVDLTGCDSAPEHISRCIVWSLIRADGFYPGLLAVYSGEDDLESLVDALLGE